MKIVVLVVSSKFRLVFRKYIFQGTPQWRKGWFSPLLNRSVLLCNACGLKYHKNQFCPYCYFVYGKEHSEKHNHGWLTCNYCSRWVHVNCEQTVGTNNFFVSLSQAFAGTFYKQSPDAQYLCPDCRTHSVKREIMPAPSHNPLDALVNATPELSSPLFRRNSGVNYS